MATRILPREWYGRDTIAVARELLGKVLVVRSRTGARAAARIVETEAYYGDDPASHCSRGSTPRCRVMFGPAGAAYVYVCYGMHTMLNLVTEREGYPGAVLIRAAEPLEGEALMRRRRGGLPRAEWTNGPGRLCRALGVHTSDRGAPLTGPRLCVLDDGHPPGRVLTSGRVGINVAREKLWRFFVAGNPFVSRAPQNAAAA